MIAITPINLKFQTPVISGMLQEELLIDQIRNRNAQQFTLLYKQYSPALLGIVSRIVRSDVIAEDVLQESFIKIWQGIDSYDMLRGRLFTWMAATARHTAIDHLRRRMAVEAGKTSSIDEFAGDLGNHYKTEINPDAVDVRQLAGSLEGIEKEILDLIYFRGYTHSEAAEVLNIPVGTVKTRLRRAVNALRIFFAC